MSLNHSKGRLLGLSRELLRLWQDTQPHWRDEKGREFDTAHLQPLLDAVDHATAAIEDLDKMLHRLHQDCEL